MNERERLIELIDGWTGDIPAKALADYILTNGFIEEIQNEAYDLGVDSALHHHFGLSWGDAAGLRKEVERLKDALRWIPVTERLPEKGGEYLCLCHIDGHTEYGFFMVLRYYLVDKNPHFQHECEHGLRVTHWMQIPEPPKEEK